MSSADHVPSETARGPRTLRACDACRSKKIKCDGARPLCDGCKYSKLTCTYLKPHRKRAPVSGHSQSQVTLPPDSGIDSTGTPTVSTQPQPQKNLMTPRGHPSFNLASLEFQVKNIKLGDVDLPESYPFFSDEARSWIRLRTGEDVDFRSLFRSSEKTHDVGNGQSQKQDPYSIVLPSEDELQEMAIVYFSSESHKVFPLFSRDIVFGTIGQVYLTLGARICVASGRSIILSMLSFFSRVEQRHPSLLDSNPSIFSQAALDLLPDIFMEGLSLGAFGAISLLCADQSSFGKIEILEQLVGIATRMLYALGGHLQPSLQSGVVSVPGIPMTPQHQAHVRKIFWVIYSLDKDLCFRTLHPPMINDGDCDMTVDPVPAASLSDSENPPFYPADIRLAILKAQIYQDLYSVKARHKSDTELLRTIRELDEELDLWRSNLPSGLRPLRSEIMSTFEATARDMRLLLLHLEYQQCLIMIHEPSNRISTWNTGNRANTIQSSLDLCVEASRSTLYYLLSSRSLPRAESFWIVSHYPISSLVTIFCHLTQHPQHSRAVEDYGLLTRAAETLAQGSNQGLLEKDAEYVKSVSSFFIELTRLAKCAMDKACG